MKEERKVSNATGLQTSPPSYAMGLCTSIEVSKEDMAKSKEIDTQIKADKKMLDREVKLLLLGPFPLFPVVSIADLFCQAIINK